MLCFKILTFFLDNWDELQSTLSEVSDSDDEGEVAILSSQVLKQTKEDSDSEDSDDEVSLNHSKGSSGKLKKSQTKKPHERNPSMGGGVFEMELSDAKKGIQYKLKSADDEGDFSGVNVVETTCGKHEYYNLKCIYVRGRTGFEESRDFPIRLHDVIAGRYEIIEYLGSAAFSRAVQCLDHMTGQMVCVKIIKNNKDFFDQSLDEIKLLKYIKANGDTEENHVIKMLGTQQPCEINVRANIIFRSFLLQRALVHCLRVIAREFVRVLQVQ